METYLIMCKLVDALLSGTPVVIFDKDSEQLNRWILIKNIKICDNGMIFVEDNEEHSWLVSDWEIFTMEEFNKLSK